MNMCLDVFLESSNLTFPEQCNRCCWPHEVGKCTYSHWTSRPWQSANSSCETSSGSSAIIWVWVFFPKTPLHCTSLNNECFFFCSGPVIKVYLWDNVATEFCRKFKSCETTPTVLLITTVNTKRLGGFHLRLYYCLLTFIHVQFEFFKCVFRNITGTLALTSMSSSRVFMDYDVQPTIDYFAWWVFMYFIFTLSLNQVTCPWTLPNH